ncbi:hypothetical protein RND71_019645 [Anisodus tanguticus]|uniref:Uncharacterized protein n=1 Tax=Anisodus tanguticus TaxID=243964 RepID=A0AAE1S0X3_9SOLA|nr:hypothetical protein RND71_019645 [Anisodus tanguticus]
MKMSNAGGASESSKKKMSSRRLGKFLKELKGRLYIMRRCVVMLLCGIAEPFPFLSDSRCAMHRVRDHKTENGDVHINEALKSDNFVLHCKVLPISNPR